MCETTRIRRRRVTRVHVVVCTGLLSRIFLFYLACELLQCTRIVVLSLLLLCFPHSNNEKSREFLRVLEFVEPKPQLAGMLISISRISH